MLTMIMIMILISIIRVMSHTNDNIFGRRPARDFGLLEDPANFAANQIAKQMNKTINKQSNTHE